MKQALCFLLAMGSLAFAGPAQAADCSQKEDAYIVDQQEALFGARKWDLATLYGDARAGDACAAQIEKKALQESLDYWKHIAERYHCVNKAGVVEASVACAGGKAETVKANLKYIADLNAEKKEKAAAATAQAAANCVKCKIPGASAPVKKETAEALRDISRRLPPPGLKLDPAKDPKCLAAMGSKSELGGSADNSSEADEVAAGIFRCVEGLVKGFFRSPADMIEGLWAAGHHPIATATGLSDMAAAFYRDPAKTIKNIALHFIQQYTKYYKNWHCWNGKTKTQIICHSIGQGGMDAVMTALGLKAAAPLVSAADDLAKAGAAATAEQAKALATKAGKATAEAAAKGKARYQAIKAGTVSAVKAVPQAVARGVVHVAHAVATGKDAIVAKAADAAESAAAVKKAGVAATKAAARKAGAAARAAQAQGAEAVLHARSAVATSLQKAADLGVSGKVQNAIVKKYGSQFSAHPGEATAMYETATKNLVAHQEKAVSDLAAAKASGASFSQTAALRKALIRANDEVLSHQKAYEDFAKANGVALPGAAAAAPVPAVQPGVAAPPAEVAPALEPALEPVKDLPEGPAAAGEAPEPPVAPTNAAGSDAQPSGGLQMAPRTNRTEKELRAKSEAQAAKSASIPDSGLRFGPRSTKSAVGDDPAPASGQP